MRTYLSFELGGCSVLRVPIEELTEDEVQILFRIGKPVPALRAQSAECNPQFAALWSAGDVDGLYRRKKRI